METDPAPRHDEIRLPFEPGDRFIQVHENGAILVVADDYQWNLATLGQAVAVGLEAVDRGTRVLLAHEVLDDRTVAVLEAVRGTGAEIVEFGTVIPPMTWPDGTTPLMTAATLGRTDLVDDLLARGVPAGGVVSVPLADVRGIIVAPAHGLNGAPWRVVLCQDAVGRRATPARVRAADPAFTTTEEAERFAGLAERYQVVVLGRGPSTEAVLAALRPGLDRPHVVGNRWWHELERHSAYDVMTSRRHRA